MTESRRPKMTRRGILQGIVAIPAVIRSGVLGAAAPSKRINLAAFGVGNRGSYINDELSRSADARYVAVCDAYRSRREKKRQEWNALYGGDYVRTYDNPWEVLKRKDVDAIVVATPDHWHVPLAIAAVRAGKDMYVEKPLSVAMTWAWKLRKAMNGSGRIFQYGTQQRSAPQFRYACELVRNGYLGKITHIDAWCPDKTEWYSTPHVRPNGSVRPISPPEDLNFDLWTGPSPERPYTADRCTSNGCYHTYDYALGFIAGWGAHPLDIAQWGLNTDHTGPVYYEGWGTLPKFGLFDTIDQWDVACHYDNGPLMRFMSHRVAQEVVSKYRDRWSSHGTTFFGSEGWVSVDRRGLEASKPSLERIEFKGSDQRLYESANHGQNFLECIRSRKEAISPLESAIRSDTISHLCDIMIRTGRPIEWDPKREEIAGNPQAAKMLDRPIRSRWAF
jgi:predicted dehydrogenase